MSEKPKLRWFRFHLSTVLMGTVASGFLMFMNFICYDSPGWIEDRSGEQWLIPSTSKCRGWPFVHSCWKPEDQFSIPNLLQQLSDPGFGRWLWMNAIYDLMIAGAIVIAAFVVAESLLRRREARKPS